MRDILTRARALIANPTNWIQGEYANGSLIDPDTKRFCTLGAVDRAVLEKHNKVGSDQLLDPVYFAEQSPEGQAAIQLLQKIVPGGWVAEFNDNPDTTHADVLNLFDQAIEHA